MEDNVRQIIDYYLGLPDAALAEAYSDWSESTHAAGWLDYGIPIFVKAILEGNWEPSRWEPEDYVAEGVVEIRKLLKEARH